HGPHLPPTRHPAPTRRSSDLGSSPARSVRTEATATTTAKALLVTAHDTSAVPPAMPGRWPIRASSRTANTPPAAPPPGTTRLSVDRKSTRLNSSHVKSSYAVF